MMSGESHIYNYTREQNSGRRNRHEIAVNLLGNFNYENNVKMILNVPTLMYDDVDSIELVHSGFSGGCFCCDGSLRCVIFLFLLSPPQLPLTTTAIIKCSVLHCALW
jgi:hypothetical protein